MIDIEIRRRRPRRAIVRRQPTARCRRARRVGHDRRAVPLQHLLPRVARPGDGDPVREQRAAVATLRALRGDGEGREGAFGGGGAGDVWGRGLGCWGGEGEDGGEEEGGEEEEVLHLDPIDRSGLPGVEKRCRSFSVWMDLRESLEEKRFDQGRKESNNIYLCVVFF